MRYTQDWVTFFATRGESYVYPPPFVLRPFVLRLSALMPFPKLRHFLICALFFGLTSFWLAAFCSRKPPASCRNIFVLRRLDRRPLFSGKQLGRKARAECDLFLVSDTPPLQPSNLQRLVTA